MLRTHVGIFTEHSSGRGLRYLFPIYQAEEIATTSQTMSEYNIYDNIRLPPKWIELNITKRECNTFLAVPDNELVCQCGRRKIDHGDFVKPLHRLDHWSPTLHTRVFSTDAYGTILFEGDHHPNKAHYARIDFATKPEVTLQLMRHVWGLPMPKLIISIRGGTTDFHLSSRLGRILQNGLIKAAKTSSAWVFSNGFNTGVAKHLGTVLNNERWLGATKRGHIVSVGIAPWGMCEHKNELIGRNKDRIYSPLKDSGSTFLHLNPRHSNFLLVDNGTIGKFGGENYLRRRLEKYLSMYPTGPNRACDTPIVCIVLEGSFHTLRTVHEYLHEEPPVPVVVFAETGKCADILAWMIKKFSTEEDFESHKEEIKRKITHNFQTTDLNQCSVLLHEIREIFQKRNLITIFTPSATAYGDEEFDTVILASIFRSQHWSPLQQLSLTLVWDRVDIAKAEVFVYGREWSREHLEHAMMEALVSNRLQFVHLLLEHGLNMQSFLTTGRLESLYRLEHMPSKAVGGLLMEFAQIRPAKLPHRRTDVYEKNLTLHDIGVAMSHMMGRVYRSGYMHMLSKLRELNEDDVPLERQIFSQPFDDLFIWAVLTKRHDMSKLLWPHGHGTLAKALVAVCLNRYIANVLKSYERSMTNLVMEFESHAEDWENLSLALVDSCYRSDAKMARQLLTMQLENWSKQTCLTLAVMANHRMMLGHPCCQTLLLDLWMGAINIKSRLTLKITLCILFPPLCLLLDYKTTEELRLLPHQEQRLADMEHHFNQQQQTKPPGDMEQQLASKHDQLLEDHDIDNETAPSVYKSHRKTDLAHVASRLGVTKSRAKSSKKALDVYPSAYCLRQEAAAVRMSEKGGDMFPGKVGTATESEELSRTLYGKKMRVSSFVTTEHNLSAWNKFVEFQKAPVTNFYRHTVAYLVFIVALTYIILYPQNPDKPGWVEMYVIACMISEGLEFFRELNDVDAMRCTQKLILMMDNKWQVCDFLVVIYFLSGVTLRFTPGYFRYGMLLYRTSSIYWNLRLYKYLSVHWFIGPKIQMMIKMFQHMAFFAMIILVVLISFGVAREAIRFPDMDRSFKDLADAFLEPYIMMFGEVDLDAVSPQCGEGDNECPLGSWIIPTAWIVYMLTSNFLISNLLIAVFNGIYAEIDAMAEQVWMFQRFNCVMEFQQKPLLPPPLIIVSHAIGLVRYFCRKCMSCLCEEELLEHDLDEEDKSHIIVGNDHNLKSFLSNAEQHMVADFEEENLDTLGHLLYKEHHSEHKIGYVNNIMSEKLGMQRVFQALEDIGAEMTSHKGKLDRLIAYWEMDLNTTVNEDDSESMSSTDQRLPPPR